MNSTAQLAMKK